jgi:uncharacterized protein
MQLPFITGCLTEVALLLLAMFCGFFLHAPPLATCRWELPAVLLGFAAAIPPLLFFLYTLHSRVEVFVRHTRLLETLLRPLMGTWSVTQLAVISLLAGISEEALFRGFLQGALNARFGQSPAILVASIVFGLAHPLSRTYVVFASLLGVYHGLLWSWTGNLLTPITTHAAYDFLALLYFLRIRRPPS